MSAAASPFDQIGNNRLAVLAAEIRVAHAGVVAAATLAAERAIEAGKALTEAKGLLPHGGWLPWLKDHCQLSVRTAQVYMKIVRLGLTAPIVAEIGLQAAGDTLGVFHDPGYDAFANCDEAQQRLWILFGLFIGDHDGHHIEWILQRQFVTPDEWLGPEGTGFRKRTGLRELVGEQCRPAWAKFQEEYQDKTQAEIEAEIAAMVAPVRAKPRPRNRRGLPKNAAAAYLPDTLAERVRGLMAESDPDALRAGLAAVAAELDARRAGAA